MAKKKRTTKKTEPDAVPQHEAPATTVTPQGSDLHRLINAGEQARDDSGCDAQRWETWYQDACKAAGATLDLPDVGDVRVQAERRRAFNLCLKQLRRRLA